MQDLLPAVVTLGTREVQNASGRVWQELASGAVVHVIDRRTGRHKGWVVRGLEPGYQASRVPCGEFSDHLGGLLDQVRDGFVFEVFDGWRHEVRGYLQWCPPDSIRELDTALQFAQRRSRSGNVRMRDIWPLETSAR